MAGYNNDFLEWYKKNYNSDYDSNKGYARGENITDEDWEVGNNLYQAYIRKNDLSNQFNRTKESLEKEKSKSQQAASVQLDKLQKYLPTQIRAQGLGGLGVSESTLLQAQNNYQNTLGEIDSDIGSRQMELLNNYQSGVNALEEEKSATNQSIFDKYTNIKREEEQKEYERQQVEYERKQQEGAALYNEILNTLEMKQNTMNFDDNNKISIAEKQQLLDYANEKMQGLPENLKTQLQTYLDSVLTRTSEEDKQRAYTNASSQLDSILSGNQFASGDYAGSDGKAKAKQGQIEVALTDFFDKFGVPSGVKSTSGEYAKQLAKEIFDAGNGWWFFDNYGRSNNKFTDLITELKKKYK
jgi:hypothetical protein